MINKILQGIYVFIFIFAIGLIYVMHTVPAPALAVLRIPRELREVCPTLALGWPRSLEVYHAFLLSFFAVIILNGIGLYRLHFPKWRTICQASSLMGLFTVISIFLSFKLPFGLKNHCDSQNLQTSLIYSSFLFVFFIINLLTFAVARKRIN